MGTLIFAATDQNGVGSVMTFYLARPFGFLWATFRLPSQSSEYIPICYFTGTYKTSAGFEPATS